MVKKMNMLDWLAFVLLIMSGLFLLVMGIFGFNLVEFIFSNLFLSAKAVEIGTRMVYSLIGVTSIYSIYTMIKVNFL